MEFDRTGFDHEVGVRLGLARKRRKLTQEELALRIGVPRATYANVEAGRQRIPLDIVWRAAVVLGVQVSALVPEPIGRSRHEEMIEASDVPAGVTTTGATVTLTSTPSTIEWGVPARGRPRG